MPDPQDYPVSESTPLLSSSNGDFAAVSNSSSHLPPVAVTVDRILQLERPITEHDMHDGHWHMNTSDVESAAKLIAYYLVVLLEARKRGHTSTPTTLDVYKNWDIHTKSKAIERLLDTAIMHHWTSFISEYRSPLELDIVFWSSFPYVSASHKQVRVADLMSSPTTPDVLTSHPITLMMFSHTWKHGSLVSYQGTHGILGRYDRICTPQRVHLVELFTNFIYIGLLAHYIMFPPAKFHISGSNQQVFGLREYLLMILALSLITSWNIYRILSPLIVMLCMVFVFPSPIYPDTNGFGFLLFAFLLSLFPLHGTYPPTPLLFFHPNRYFPLSVYIRWSLSSVIQPVGQFFAPISLFLMLMLSYSMADTFPSLWASLSPTVYIGPAPMQTRATLLFTILILLGILGFSAMVLILSAIVLTISGLRSDDRWFRFSQPVGLEAQRAFLKCVALYTKSYTFPAPFNLLATAVQVPLYLWAFFEWSTVEHILWRITIGPLMACLAGLELILDLCSSRRTLAQ